MENSSPVWSICKNRLAVMSCLCVSLVLCGDCVGHALTAEDAGLDSS